MDEPRICRLRLRGRLPAEWFARFDLAVSDGSGDETILVGRIPDQAALHGLLARVGDLGIELLSVEITEQTSASS